MLTCCNRLRLTSARGPSVRFKTGRLFKKNRLGSLLSPSAYRWGGKSWVSLEWNRNKSFTYETLTQSVKCQCQWNSSLYNIWAIGYLHLAYNTDDKIILMQSIKSAANYSKPFQKYKHFNKSILVSHIDCLFMAHVSVIRKLILMTKRDHYL